MFIDMYFRLRKVWKNKNRKIILSDHFDNKEYLKLFLIAQNYGKNVLIKKNSRKKSLIIIIGYITEVDKLMYFLGSS